MAYTTKINDKNNRRVKQKVIKSSIFSWDIF